MLTNPEPMIASLRAHHGELTRLLLGLVDGEAVPDDIPAAYLLQFNYDEELVMDRLLNAWRLALRDFPIDGDLQDRFTRYAVALAMPGASQFLNIRSRLTVFGDTEWEHYNPIGDIKSYMTKSTARDYKHLVNGQTLMLSVLSDVVAIVFHVDSIEHLLRYGWTDFKLEPALVTAVKILEDLSVYAARLERNTSLQALSLIGKD